MLKETSESTRAYIGFVAMFAFLPAFGQLISIGKINSPIAIFGLLLGGAYAYIGIRWHALLAKNPGQIRNVATANFFFATLFIAYRLFRDRDGSILLGIVGAAGFALHINAAVGQ